MYKLLSECVENLLDAQHQVLANVLEYSLFYSINENKKSAK